MPRVIPAPSLDGAGPFSPIVAHKTIGLAVSGGADSLALMLLAHRWAQAQSVPPRLIVYSVDHQLRPEAAAEVAFVVGEAANLGLRARGLRWEGDKPKTGVQAAARHARYRLMARAMAEDGAEVLLTAHHRTDQAETVLMRMAHGSGLGGMAGMAAFAEVEGITVFRPLLGVDPADLRQVVSEAGLVPMDDSSNGDDHYERVRWRKALPGFAALGLDAQALAVIARRAGEADEALEVFAGEAFARIVTVDGLGAVRIEREAFSRLPRAVAVKVLERALAAAGGSRRQHVLGQVEELVSALVEAREFKRRTLLGCIVKLGADHVWLVREPGRAIGQAVDVLPGTSIVWDNRFTIANQSSKLPVAVRMASEWNRKAAEALLEIRVVGPIEGLRASPLVLDRQGSVLALGQHRFDDSIEVVWLAREDRLLDQSARSRPQ